MSRRASFLAMAAAATLGFALIAWVSTAGSVQMLQTPTATASPPQLPRPTPERRQTPPDTASQTPAPTSPRSHGPDLSWVGAALTTLLLSLATIGLVMLIRWVWLRRRHRPTRLPEVPFEVLPEVALAVLVADAPAQFAALEMGSPRNAIVACWLRLEQAVGQAGFPRHPAETSTEFTRRVLGALAIDAAMLNGFARFYREARFSRHELGEPARRAAIAALRSLYDDIAASGTPISPDVRNEEVR